MPSKTTFASRRKTRLAILRLQSRAFRHYGVTPDQFLHLTPSELAAIEREAIEELKEKERREDRRTARLMAAVYNNHPYKKKGKTYSENDFLPKERKNRSAADLFAKTVFFHNLLTAKHETEAKKHGG